MGFVWNILLCFDNEEFWDEGADTANETCEALDRVNAWLPYGRLEGLAGNGLDANLYGAGFEHFDIDGFIDVVKAQNWKERSKVQLWVKGAEEFMGGDPFMLVKLGGRREAAVKAAATRKRRAPGAKAAATKKRRAAGRKAATTRKANGSTHGP